MPTLADMLMHGAFAARGDPHDNDNKLYNHLGSQLLWAMNRYENEPETTRGPDFNKFHAYSAYRDLLNFSADRVPAADANKVLRATHPDLFKSIDYAYDPADFASYWQHIDEGTRRGRKAAEEYQVQPLKGYSAATMKLEPKPEQADYMHGFDWEHQDELPGGAEGQEHFQPSALMPNARQDVYNAIDNQNSPFGQTWRIDATIPTAKQEALQQPLIDPVFTAMLGPFFGLRSMLGSLGMQALRSELPGATPTSVGLAGIPAPAGLFQGALSKIGDQMYKFGRNAALTDLSGFMGDMPLEQQLEYAHDAIMEAPHTLADWTSDFVDRLGKYAPDLRGEMSQQMDPTSQVAAQFQQMVRPPAPLPYPGADIGRPLGLAALLQTLRSSFGSPAPGQQTPYGQGSGGPAQGAY